MIYFNNRNGSSGLTRSLIPRLISVTAIYGRWWNSSLCWKGRWYPTICFLVFLLFFCLFSFLFFSFLFFSFLLSFLLFFCLFCLFFFTSFSLIFSSFLFFSFVFSSFLLSFLSFLFYFFFFSLVFSSFLFFSFILFCLFFSSFLLFFLLFFFSFLLFFSFLFFRLFFSLFFFKLMQCNFRLHQTTLTIAVAMETDTNVKNFLKILFSLLNQNAVTTIHQWPLPGLTHQRVRVNLSRKIFMTIYFP